MSNLVHIILIYFKIIEIAKAWIDTFFGVYCAVIYVIKKISKLEVFIFIIKIICAIFTIKILFIILTLFTI